MDRAAFKRASELRDSLEQLRNGQSPNPWTQCIQTTLDAWEKESGEGPVPVQDVLEFFYEACAESRRDVSYGAGMTLSTVHSAKGMEYRTGAEPALPRGNFPGNYEGMFQKHNEHGYQPALQGIERKTLVHGDKTLMTEFRLRKGSVLPPHSHPQEQTGYLVRGHMRLFIGGHEHDVHPGDSWCIPGEVEHGADILEDAVAIEVFSPVRDDYLPRVHS